MYVAGEFLPETKIHPEMFKGSKRPFSKPKSHLVAMKRHNKRNSHEKSLKNVKNFLKGHKKRSEKLKELGIEYNFSGLVRIYIS